MAKSISSGIDKLVSAQRTEKEKRIEEISHQWRLLRNRLDSLLLGTNILKSNDVRQLCQALDIMDSASREQYITTNWGPLYTEKARPLLQQIASLEVEINRVNEIKTIE